MFKNAQKQLLKQLKTTHSENLKKNLQHRLEAARTSGDNKLLQQLEAEARYLDLN